MHGDLCSRCGVQHCQRPQSQKSSSLSTHFVRPSNLYVGLVVEEAKDHEDQDMNGLEPLVHSTPVASESSPSDHENLDIHLADDGLGKALAVMTAVQVSGITATGQAFADHGSAFKTYLSRLMATGRKLGRVKCHSWSPHL